MKARPNIMSDKSKLKFLVDGKLTSPSLIRIPTMGLSSSRENMVARGFQLTVSASLLCEKGKPAWDNYVAACKRDDARRSGPDKDDWVAMAGYPPLERVIEDPEELDFLFGMGGGLALEVFPKVCGFKNSELDEKDKFNYLYLDERTVEKADDQIICSGTCYQAMIP